MNSVHYFPHNIFLLFLSAHLSSFCIVLCMTGSVVDTFSMQINNIINLLALICSYENVLNNRILRRSFFFRIIYSHFNIFCRSIPKLCIVISLFLTVQIIALLIILFFFSSSSSRTIFVESFRLQIFFVLRKKNSQVSTLHVIHHGCMPMSVWFGVKFTPGMN